MLGSTVLYSDSCGGLGLRLWFGDFTASLSCLLILSINALHSFSVPFLRLCFNFVDIGVLVSFVQCNFIGGTSPLCCLSWLSCQMALLRLVQLIRIVLLFSVLFQNKRYFMLIRIGFLFFFNTRISYIHVNCCLSNSMSGSEVALKIFSTNVTISTVVSFISILTCLQPK